MWRTVAIATISALASHQLEAFATEASERTLLYQMGLRISAHTTKPFLIIGMPKDDYPCSPDVTIDIDPRVTAVCPTSGMIADVRDIPYPDKSFAATFISHVLEHLPSLEDVSLAWREVWRISDTVFVAYPRKANLIAQLAPQHHLWVTPTGTELFVEERNSPWRAAIVRQDGSIV